MFGKEQAAISNIHFALSSLAYVSPTSILPKLLSISYDALESVENHRVVSSIGALAAVAIPLINRNNFPEGATHILGLINFVLPGIDINDPTKTLYSLQFIQRISMLVPFYDISDGFDDNEIDEKIRASTAGFQEWVMSFLDRVLRLVCLFNLV